MREGREGQAPSEMKEAMVGQGRLGLASRRDRCRSRVAGS